MHTRYRWQNWCWSAGLALVLVGCGLGEAPKATSGAAPRAAPPAAPRALTPAVVEPTAATDAPAEQPIIQPAAKPASPASLEEVTRVIDFRKFPAPDGENAVNKSPTILSYPLRKMDAAQAAQFYRSKFAESGWKLGEELVIKEKGY